MSKVALVCGAAGQDGTYLVDLLLRKNYTVWATSRDAQAASFSNWNKIGIDSSIVNKISMDPEDFRSVFMALRSSCPDEIYYLAGQSSVGLSFELPAETVKGVTIGVLNVLEACRMFDRPVRLYAAGSSETFGSTCGAPAVETTALRPSSPYAVAKASAYWLVKSYRETYGVFACTGILFNHESPLRPARFVTQKIVAAACGIVSGAEDLLHLGRVDIRRDWGWAPEYVEAMWLMLQQDSPEDFVVATGTSATLEQFVAEAFRYLGLDWKEHVRIDESIFRPTDLVVSNANPSKAERQLGWKARYTMPDVVKGMVEANMQVRNRSGS
ncbi:GDP-mannose 4,6-dehydratase [Pseudomonas stutzeri]|uniref:GDP-mannose 4,6-dehydratase n=1 Tax=Stutzerimonas stutzeri TaxID=316 RepID=UPI00210D5E70|nr:GDP-mannose 4,6-dehydratase [Stutzerimonas stutzeri]MCQ4312600.1 GDP-mannose 4,6-dehydratase [Stutzerimonas stutzeri]